MIKGVGTERAINSWTPLVAVAGYRAQKQAQYLIENRDNYITRLGITEKDFDSFLMNWVAPLSEIENYPSKSDKHQCNCRGSESRRGIGSTFAVLNLVDLLDIIVNVGFTEYIFDGVTNRYRDEGSPRILQCLSCLGTFTGIVFTKQWDDIDITNDERKPIPALSFITQGMPLNTFTQTWLLYEWVQFSEVFKKSTGFSTKHFFHIINDMVSDIIATYPELGSGWNLLNTMLYADSNHVKERFNKWVEHGADHETAIVGVLLEIVTMQKKSIPSPSTEIISTVMNPMTRYTLVKHVDTYVNEVLNKQSKHSKISSELPFNVIVKMSQNDIDHSLLTAMLEGTN